jgi:hypothetical protein
VSSDDHDPARAALFGEIQAAAHARRALVLTGPNTSDLFQRPGGAFVYLPELVALAHAERGRIAVVRSSLGIVQDPVPGQAAVPLRLPPADTPPGQALRELHDQLLTCTQPIVVTVDYANLALPSSVAGSQPSADQQLLIETLARFPIDVRLAEHRLVVIDRADDLDPRLARLPGWEVVTVGPPAEPLRHRFAARLADRARERPESVAPLAEGFTVRELARNTGGLTLDELMRGASAASERDERLTPDWVRAAKLSRLRQRGVDGLDILDPGPSMAQVAGLPQIHLFILERLRANIWPRALVLAGPPGCGKSLVVRAIAEVLKWPAVAIGNLRGPFVGETEGNTRHALSTIEAMAPLVVFQDEVDQVMGQRETGLTADGGTSARLMAEFWKFLGDSNSGLPVLFVMASNRPDLLDNATRSRAEIVPILHPTPTEQADLLRIACNQLGCTVTTGDAGHALAGADLGVVVSGRMLVKIAQRALISARQRRDGTIELDDLRCAAHELQERVDPIEDERMALRAVEVTSFASYLPWEAAKRLGQSVELLPYVEPLLGSDGRLDLDRLAERLAALDEQAARRISVRG